MTQHNLHIITENTPQLGDQDHSTLSKTCSHKQYCRIMLIFSNSVSIVDTLGENPLLGEIWEKSQNKDHKLLTGTGETDMRDW